MELGSLDLDLDAVARAARDFLRPVGWRGTAPSADGLQGCLLFDRDRRATSFDGTEIAYTVVGSRGPWVALVPGFGCPDNFWRYLVPELRRDHRVLVYDLRGLGMSGIPRAPGFRARNLKTADFTMEHHAKDLEAVLDAEGVKKATLLGHSMGGQVVLEAYREFPGRVEGIVMLTAPYESPTRTLYGRDLDSLIRLVSWAIRSLPRSSILAWRALFLARPSLTHRAAQLLRALGPNAKAEDMATYYRHLAFLDPFILMKMADAMRQHSAADVLAMIEVPMLIVAGTADTFTPPRLAKAMHLAVPGSEILFLDGASHGAVIEFPDEVNEAVRSFLERRVHPKRAGGGGPRRATPKRRSAAARR